MGTDRVWRVCTSCKAEIAFDQIYWVCSVSTCNRKRMPMYFHEVSCWEAHLPTMRHREAYAVEKRAPSRAAWQRQQQDSSSARPTSSNISTPKRAAPTPSAAPAPRRRVASAAPASDSTASASTASDSTASDSTASDNLPRDVLIVASKMKKYIKAKSGMNTSDTVLMALSDHVRRVCDEAIRRAGADERRTVLERDIPPTR